MLDLSAIDYVRVWVQDDYGGVGCSPPHRPTQKYINDHIDVYSECVVRHLRAGFAYTDMFSCLSAQI